MVGRYLRWFLATLAAACALVHFAAAGEHFDLSWMHGGFFAAAGWLQLLWAVGLVVRPDERRLLAAGLVLHGGVAAVWVVSRTLGVPFGDDAGVAEVVGFADAVVTAFEVVLVLVSLAVLRRPSLAERPVQPMIARSGLTVAAVAIMAVSTTAVTPSFATEHGHGDDGHGGGHGVGVIQADGSSKCEESGVTNAGNSANGGHGHRGPVPWQPLDAEGRETLAVQLEAARTVVEAYPTVADAEAAGFHQATVYVPCIAAHYVAPNRGAADGFDPALPQVLLFTSTEPDGEIVGLSYDVTSPGGPPEGFEGPNDVWHSHERSCMRPGIVISVETEASQEACEARGGVLVDTSNDWMMHMWPVPQWQNRWGLFASEHPDLGGRMGDMDGPPDLESDDIWLEENE